MPLVLDGVQRPAVWVSKKFYTAFATRKPWETSPDCIHIALINNMPDAALEDTELQYFELLDAASDHLSVHLKLFSLPEVERSERVAQRMRRLYFDIADLYRSPFDALIVTGTEPHRPNLRDEPYWPSLIKVLDWAEQNTRSTVLSCLAAHAGVLYSDGICRTPLPGKQFGVFDFHCTTDHILSGRNLTLRMPHSRWNEVPAGALSETGYTVITESLDAGVDLFVKKKHRSLFVHFQGHPEYDSLTLLREYRRDTRRFLRGECDSYPAQPAGYFDAAVSALLDDFRAHAIRNRREEIMGVFPDRLVARTVQNTWSQSGISVYRNWLHSVVSRPAASIPLVALSGSAATPASL